MKPKTKDQRPKTVFRWLIFILPLVLLLIWLSGMFLIIEKPLAQADAIFVLSGSAAYPERTRRAAEIYRENRAPKIILTNDGGRAGWANSESRNPFFWELARRELMRHGVPAEAIEVLPAPVYGTHDEMILLQDLARERELKSILLVTSPLHTRRTLWTARRVLAENPGENQIEIGIETVKMPRGTALWWTSLRNWRAAASEYLKFVYYWLFY